MTIRLISNEERKNARCYFCGEDKSVKYVATIYDQRLSADNYKLSEVYCCNKCAAKLSNVFCCNKCDLILHDENE